MAARLTDVERAERSLSERDFQRQVTDLATTLGWSWAHWRALQNRRGIWQVPVEGPLGPGWPDLTLLRVRDRRLLFVELKRELEHPTPAQAGVLSALGELMVERPLIPEGMPLPRPRSYLDGVMEGMFKAQSIAVIEVHVWRPSDLRDPIEESAIYQVLR